MSNTAVRTLVLSSTSGYYALDDPVEGADLTVGTPIEIRLGGHWIAGTIAHGGGLYAVDGEARGSRGYYFISSTGQLCGLCAGMKVRLRLS